MKVFCMFWNYLTSFLKIKYEGKNSMYMHTCINIHACINTQNTGDYTET